MGWESNRRDYYVAGRVYSWGLAVDKSMDTDKAMIAEIMNRKGPVNTGNHRYSTATGEAGPSPLMLLLCVVPYWKLSKRKRGLFETPLRH